MGLWGNGWWGWDVSVKSAEGRWVGCVRVRKLRASPPIIWIPKIIMGRREIKFKYSKLSKLAHILQRTQN